MEIIKMPVGVMMANCYLLISKEKGVAIIDPGAEPQRIMKKIEELSLTPKMILLTHGHFDHVGGMYELRRNYQIPVYLHEGDADMLTSPEKNLSQMFYAPFEVVEDANLLHDGDRVQLDELEIQLIHTPGHSKGSSSYLVGEHLFTGDTLFKGSMGRYDFYGSDYYQLKDSLRKLADLKGDYIVYPGHNDTTTLEEERKTNPCLGLQDYDTYF
jgi:hydroxyacylglutathione hydrolase